MTDDNKQECDHYDAFWNAAIRGLIEDGCCVKSSNIASRLLAFTARDTYRSICSRLASAKGAWLESAVADAGR